MDIVEKVVEAVSTVGFPIVCVLMLFYLFYKEMEDRKQRDAQFTALLERNTAAINSLESLVKTLHDMEVKK